MVIFFSYFVSLQYVLSSCHKQLYQQKQFCLCSVKTHTIPLQLIKSCSSFKTRLPKGYLNNKRTSQHLATQVELFHFSFGCHSNSLTAAETKMLYFGVYRFDLFLTLTFAHQTENPSMAINCLVFAASSKKYLVFIRYLINVS